MPRYEFIVYTLDPDGHSTGYVLNNGAADATEAGELAWELAAELSHRAEELGYRVEVWQPGTHGELTYQPAATATVDPRGRAPAPPRPRRPGAGAAHRPRLDAGTAARATRNAATPTGRAPRGSGCGKRCSPVTG